MRSLWRIGTALLLLAILVVLVALLLHRVSVRAVETRATSSVVTTLQRETPEQFLVVGRLDITSTVSVTSTRILFPEVLDLPVGSAEARVRVPGRVSYGYDFSDFTDRDVRISDRNEVEIRLPPLRVYAVDPQMNALEIHVRSGWFKPEGGERRVTQEALTQLRTALEQQAAAHLRDSAQPRVNGENAIRDVLRPVLQSAGISNPTIRFVEAAPVVSEPEG